ncbi:MAG: serine/threonine-protein kinase [Myxococcota bacterium]
MSKLGRLPLVGDTIDRYQVLAELAHGGMAAVYAVGRQTDSFTKIFAMKVMLPHLVSDEHFVNMFMDEARIAAFVQHSNVVQVFDVGMNGQTPYLVMEYLKGQSLSALRRRVPNLPMAARLLILAEAARGLHAAHHAKNESGEALQVVHRDVSPQNIHISYDGSVKVVDFGIAAAEGRVTRTRTGEVKGKFSYAAPEQLRGSRDFDLRLDLWALGVVAWELLAKGRLFRAQNDSDTVYNVLHQDVPDLSERGVPDAAAAIVEACLQRTPELRPASALAVERAFREAMLSLEGYDSTQLGELMNETFSAERAVEEDRVATAIGTPREPVRVNEETSDRIGGVEAMSEPPRGSASRGRWVALGGLVALGLGAAGWGLRDAPASTSAPVDPSPPASTPDAVPTETLPTEPVPTEPLPIEAERALAAPPEPAPAGEAEGAGAPAQTEATMNVAPPQPAPAGEAEGAGAPAQTEATMNVAPTKMRRRRRRPASATPSMQRLLNPYGD